MTIGVVGSTNPALGPVVERAVPLQAARLTAIRAARTATAASEILEFLFNMASLLPRAAIRTSISAAWR
jgi:hypothetical protein